MLVGQHERAGGLTGYSGFSTSPPIMSRGDRAATGGNLSLSMRDNYGEHGVDEVRLNRYRLSNANM